MTDVREEAETMLLERGWQKHTAQVSPGIEVNTAAMYYDLWAAPGASSYVHSLDTAIAELVRRG